MNIPYLKIMVLGGLVLAGSHCEWMGACTCAVPPSEVLVLELEEAVDADGNPVDLSTLDKPIEALGGSCELWANWGIFYHQEAFVCGRWVYKLQTEAAKESESETF